MKIRRGDVSKHYLLSYLYTLHKQLLLLLITFIKASLHYLTNLLMTDWSGEFSTLDQSTPSHPNYDSEKDSIS